MTDQQSRQALDEALTHAALGHKIVPVPHMEKYPKGIGKWQEKGAPDEKQVYEWWGESTNGIGWVMGLQPNGTFLIAIDVDVANGKPGAENIKELWNSYQIKPAFSATIQAITGSGGRHFIFKAPPGCGIGNPRLGEALDTRGNGGFIVISPSIHPNGQRYQWVEGHAPWECDPVLIPGVILDMLKRADEPKPQPVAPTLKRAPSEFNDDPKQWVKDQFTCLDFLEGLGWQSAGKNAWTRPGKSVRDGSSAEYHPNDDVFNVFTSTDMHIYEQFGYRGNGCITLNAFDLWAITYKHATVSSAMSAIRKAMPKPSASPGGSTTTIVPRFDEAEGSTAVVPTSHPLNLPPEFWDARPVLSHIRQAAWSMSASPDAVLAGVMARYSANIPTAIRLPRMGTLDVFFVIAGHSGSGKSSAGKVAGQLYPGNYAERGVMMDRQVGSGEGLAEAFFEWRDEDGAPCSATKKGATKVLARWGMHFATDEGAALTASAGRVGSILIPTLCAAWMGESIGQLLADPSKSRMIPPMKVRVSAEVRIQTAHGFKLFSEDYASTGLSQRMICVSAVDPSIHERYQAGIAPPGWPGELSLPHPAIVGGESVMVLCDELVGLFAQFAADAHNPAWAGDPLDTHAALSALKLASILALWEDRADITTDDWDLAQIILASHRSVRAMLQATKVQADNQRRVTAVTMEAEKVVAIDDAKHKHILRGTVSAMQGLLDDGVKPSRKHLSRAQREVFEEAQAFFVKQGLWPE